MEDSFGIACVAVQDRASAPELALLGSSTPESMPTSSCLLLSDLVVRAVGFFSGVLQIIKFLHFVFRLRRLSLLAV